MRRCRTNEVGPRSTTTEAPVLMVPSRRYRKNWIRRGIQPSNGLIFEIQRPMLTGMRVPNQPVSLSVEQIAELNQKLSTMRHDINNYLALILAATELMRYKPEVLDKMLPTLREQPAKIGDALQKFSTDFDTLFGIKDV